MSSELKKAVDALVTKEPGWKEFTPAPAKGAKPGPVGKGVPGSGGNGAVAFEESDYSLRQYWPAVTLTSSDGLMTIEVQPIKSIALVAGLATFKAPPA